MSTAATAVPEEEATPTTFVSDRLADFSDKLSPMLVKELRQGLRAKTFVIVFLTLQVLLGLVLLSSLGAADSPQDAGHNISSIIFMFFGIAALVIQPVRGIGALHREVQGQTIELMVLTRLSAWKIVLGKWISIVAQTGLLLAAVAPYLILRYWFGDMNLFGELMLLLLVFILSAAATGIIVGISCVPSVILRGLLPLLVAAWGLFVIPMLSFDGEFDDLVNACAMQSSGARWAIFSVVMAAAYLAWTALGLGASLIAPAAENHSTQKRAVALALFALAIGISLITDPSVYYLITIAFIVGIPAIIMALTEPINLMPPLYKPFVKKGALGMMAGRLLYPGWPSGVLFSTVIALLAFVLIVFCGDRNLATDESTIPFAIFGSLLLPAAILSFLDKKVRNRFTVFLLLMVIQFVLTMVLSYVGFAMDRDARGFLWFFSWIPMVTLPMSDLSPSINPGSVLYAAIACCAVYGLILLVQASLRFRAIRELEIECRQELSNSES
ncbi:MAG: hypothetical protein AAGI48_16070 [Verrucomicrobiota bacterium]